MSETPWEEVDRPKPDDWEEVNYRPPRRPRSGLVDALRKTATAGTALRLPRRRLDYLRGLYATATRSGLVLHWRSEGENLIAWMEKRPNP